MKKATLPPVGPLSLELTSPTLRDYALFQSGNEAPLSYHVFSLLTLAGALLECRVWVDWEYDKFVPNLYVCLVGPQGNRKGVAAKGARKLVESVDESHPWGEPIISKESTITRLSQPDASRAYQWKEKTVVFQPITFVATELKNSLAINPYGLVDWLTHVYEGERSSSNTVKRGVEKVENPCVTILGCETTDGIVERLRTSILSGGFCRRMLFVVEERYGARVARPKVPPGGYEAMERVRKRLEAMKTLTGEVTMAGPARKWYDRWYENVQAPAHKMGRAWYTSKHVHLVKIAMILAALDEGSRVLTLPHFQQAMSLLDATEPALFRLLAQAGQNKMLPATFELLGRLEAGPLEEHVARQLLFDYCTARECDELLRHLQLTRQIKTEVNGNGTALVRLAPGAPRVP